MLVLFVKEVNVLSRDVHCTRWDIIACLKVLNSMQCTSDDAKLTCTESKVMSLIFPILPIVWTLLLFCCRARKVFSYLCAEICTDSNDFETVCRGEKWCFFNESKLKMLYTLRVRDVNIYEVRIGYKIVAKKETIPEHFMNAYNAFILRKFWIFDGFFFKIIIFRF